MADDTDYAKRDGKYYPGSMIPSRAKDGSIYSSVSSGVLVQEGTEVRLTCSRHCRETQDKKHPNLLGQDHDEARRVFGVLRGEKGTYAGQAVQRFGKTDNRADGARTRCQVRKLSDITAAARKFVRSELVGLFDEFLVGTSTTGGQRLMSLGRRWQTARKPGQRHSHLAAPDGDDSALPADEEQGVCGTSDPVLRADRTSVIGLAGRSC